MIKKVIKIFIILLIIPTIFTFILYKINTRKVPFKQVVSFPVVEKVSAATYEKKYVDPDIKRADNISNFYNNNQTFVMAFGVGLAFLFVVLYVYLTKRKEW